MGLGAAAVSRSVRSAKLGRHRRHGPQRLHVCHTRDLVAAWCAADHVAKVGLRDAPVAVSVEPTQEAEHLPRIRLLRLEQHLMSTGVASVGNITYNISIMYILRKNNTLWNNNTPWKYNIMYNDNNTKQYTMKEEENIWIFSFSS